MRIYINENRGCVKNKDEVVDCVFNFSHFQQFNNFIRDFNNKIMKKSYCVINFKGEEEPFSFKKVYQSARRVGASGSLAREIAENIQQTIYPGIKTSEIFDKVKNLLRKENSKAAIKFSLKKAIQKLGPTGFPFEKYIGAIFKSFGFKVKLNQYFSGLCLKYEIDFLAQKRDLLYIGECKYRNLLLEKSIHSNIILANYARFLDLKDGTFLKQKKFGNFKIKSILVTDAKFTFDAIKFSRCRDTELLGWRYPKNKGLEYFIESQNLYPITILPSLKNYLAEIFVSKKIMLVKDFLKLNIFKFSKENKIPLNYLEALAKEGKILLGIK